MLEKLLLGTVQPRQQQQQQQRPEVSAHDQSTATTEASLLPQPPPQQTAAGAPPHPIDSENVDLAGTARATQGFSGSDVRLLCKEAAMKPVR